MAFPQLNRFSTHIPGDPGDAFLIFTLLRWGASTSTSLFSGFWQGPMYASGENVMAYTDTFLPLTIPFRALEEITGSPVLAFNILYIVSWVLCLECTYRLLVRMTSCRSAAIVGSIAFTFSTIRLTQTGHFQLMFAFLIPLVLLALFRLFDRPTIAAGLGLGIAMSSQFLIAAYYGLILIISVSAISAVALIRRRHDPMVRRLVVALGAGAVVLLVLAGPVMLQHNDVQTSTNERKDYPAAFALTLGDLRTAALLTEHLDGISALENDNPNRTAENYAYVGFFVALGVPATLVAAAFSRRARLRLLRRRRELIAVVAVGLFACAIAVGRGPILGVRMPFYDLAADVIPGVKSMLAIVRLFVFGQLALVVVAATGFVALLDMVGSRLLRVGLCAVLSGLIMFESEQLISLARVPTVQPTSVYAALETLPDEGVVAELPLAWRGLGSTYAYTEATRMVLASGDSLRSVNGYSGFAPFGYDVVVEALNQFPAPTALQTIQDLNVRYVVIHTAPLATVSDDVNASGYAFVTAEQLATILSQIPDGLVAERIDADDGVILVIADP